MLDHIDSEEPEADMEIVDSYADNCWNIQVNSLSVKLLIRTWVFFYSLIFSFYLYLQHSYVT